MSESASTSILNSLKNILPGSITYTRLMETQSDKLQRRRSIRKQTAKSKNKTMTWGPSHSFDSDGDDNDDNVNNDHGNDNHGNGNAVDCNGDDSEVRYDSSVGPQTPEAISPPKDDDDKNIGTDPNHTASNTNHNTSSKSMPTPRKLLNGIWNCASETYNEYVGNDIGMGACSTACNQCQGHEAGRNANGNANGKYQKVHSQTTIGVQQEVQKTYSSPQTRNGYKNGNGNGKYISQSDILGYPSSSQKKNSNSNNNTNGNNNTNIPKRKTKTSHNSKGMGECDDRDARAAAKAMADQTETENLWQPPPPPKSANPSHAQAKKSQSHPLQQPQPQAAQNTNTNTNTSNPQPPIKSITLDRTVDFERSISELTMRSSLGEITEKVSSSRRMAYYAVGKHQHHHQQQQQNNHPQQSSKSKSNSHNNGTGSGGNRRCYFSGEIIRTNQPFYAGSVQQGLRTLVVFCLPRAVGLPLRADLDRVAAMDAMDSSVRSSKSHKSNGSKGSRWSKMGSIWSEGGVDSHVYSRSHHEEWEEDDAGNLCATIRPDWLLQALPDPGEDIMLEMKRRYPEQFATLPQQVRHHTCWRLYVKFCFFSGLPIADGEMYYKVVDGVAAKMRKQLRRAGVNEVILSHEVMEAVHGQSAEIVNLPAKKTFAYLQKHYTQQCAKLVERVFKRASWEKVMPEV